MSNHNIFSLFRPIVLFLFLGLVSHAFAQEKSSINEVEDKEDSSDILHRYKRVRVESSKKQFEDRNESKQQIIKYSEIDLKNNPSETGYLFETFNDYDDFTTDISPWITIDTHGENTWGSGDFDFLGEGDAFAWKIMNPSETNPAIDGDDPPVIGDKYLFSVASNPNPPLDEENKWLISPEILVKENSVLSFYAKSITDQYGLERVKVYVSEPASINPVDFDKISEGNYIEVPTSWTEYEFDMSAYSGNTIRFAIENVSSDAFMLFIDAIKFYSTDTYYSYQSGDWNDPDTWTFDPSGTTLVGNSVPDNDDIAIILPNRTVDLTADVDKTDLSVNIQEGGILDMGTFEFLNTLTELKGKGTLKLASTSFPAATTNSFVQADGGVAEYYNSGDFTLPATQNTYNTLRINAPGVVATQMSNLTLNGNLEVRNGTYRINDNATPARRQISINGDVTVSNGASLTVGEGQTSTTTDPTAVANGGTAPFINYYDTQSHRIEVYGDFTNNGTVRFTNQDYPVYDELPTNGFATVYFRGITDNAIYCNGTTDFYNLVLDKGVDQTFELEVYSTSYQNFRLFGANTAGGYGGTANPNLQKALWLRNGSLVLKGLTVIPTLSEANAGGTPNGDFYIPANGALIIEGSEVIVLTTADDYQEVNTAYGVSATSNTDMGILDAGGTQSFSIYGLLRVNAGYFSTRESGGLIQWSESAGQVEIHGGVVDAKQFRTAGSSGGLTSFTQTGGVFELRGRFRRVPTSYTSVADLTSAPVNTTRETGGLNGAVGTLNISEQENVFNMSGGTIKIYDVCGDGSAAEQQKAVEIYSSSNNINVSGGTIEFIPTEGTTESDSPNFRVISTAPFGNFTVNRQSSTSVVLLDTYPLTVRSNFRLLSGDFDANDLDVTVGGNFTAANGTTYTAGENWTVFNGSTNQTASINSAATFSFNKLKVDKPAARTLTFSGTQDNIEVSDSLMIINASLNDGGKTITLVPSANTTESYVYSSGTHLGTGKIVLADDDPQVIDGDDSGVFNNLELNNTNAADAPVSLAANIAITGELTFSQDNLLNIKSHNIKLDADASIVGSNANRYIITSGEAGNAGITRAFSSGNPSFTFPIGGASTSHAAYEYTPATLSINGTVNSYGEITLIPVGYEHPATTVKDRSLTYFWRVKSDGFDLGSATVTHRFTYSPNDVVTGADITEDEYVAARFDISTSSWTNGTDTDVDDATNTIGTDAGSFLTDTDFIDGDFTAGDNNPDSPFDTPTTFYSRNSGLWNDVASWSLTDHATDNPPASPPGAGDIVVIGGQDSIWLANPNLSVANEDVRECAILKIEAGAALDIGYNPACQFGLVLNHENGNGNFRITTSFDDGSTYEFPTGDFTEFNSNVGTTEMYTTNPNAGTTYWLPNGVSSYGNLILSPLGGSNIIFPNNDLLIYGNLVTRGQNADSWFCPNWVNQQDYPTSPEVLVAKTIKIMGDLDIQGGALVWIGNGDIAQDFVVYGDVIVAPWAAITGRTGWGGATNQSLSIGGNLINNTNNAIGNGATQTLSSVNFANGTSVIPVTFFGSSTSYVSSTPGEPGPAGPRTDFYTVTVNKGTSQSDSLIIDIGGTLTTPTDDWLTLQNGTLVYRRENPSTDFTISTNTPFTIPENAGLYIDYPENSESRNILIGNANNNNNDVSLDGKFTIKAGNVYVGPIAAPNNNNDIVYSGGGYSTIDISGGQLVVNGQVRRSTATTTGVLKYYQSGGAVQINGRNQDATAQTRAKLEVVNPGSVFSMSDGTLTLVRGGGTSFGDLYLRPASGSVTGGEIIFSQGTVNAEQNYRMDASIPLNDLTITGNTANNQNATVTLMINPLELNGSLTLSNANSILDANSNNILDVSLKGDFTNNGTYNHYQNTTTFNGGVQGILGSSSTSFHNLIINPITRVNLSRDIDVEGDLTLSRGQLVLSDYYVNLSENFINNANYTDNATGVILMGTQEQEVSGTGTFSTLSLNNEQGARLLNDITLTKNLNLTQGVFNINRYLLTLGENSDITGAPFSANKMIESDGVISDVGIRKYFPIYSGPDITFTYPTGSGGKYTPAIFTYSNNDAVGYIRVNNINSAHPGVIDPDRVLEYYWEVENSGVSGVTGNLELYYNQGDVPAATDDVDFWAVRTIGGTSWSKGGTELVDENNNIITFNYTNESDLTGEYTAGEDDAFPDDIPQFTSNQNGNWDEPTIWTQTGGDPYALTGAPNGFIVTIREEDEVTLNQNFAFTYRINIEGRLNAINYGHNLGILSGNGTLYLESGTMPAGRYTDFLDCAGDGTLEYGGSGSYTVIADLYNSIPNLHFTGTGTRVLPSKDLTVCNQLLIDGPDLDNSVNNRTLTIQGTMERNSGTFFAGSGNNAKVVFAGNAPQSVGGPTGDFTGVNTFNHFEINNPDGLTIGNAGAIEVEGNLYLTQGVISTSSTNTVTITNTNINSVFPDGGTTSSYVDGPLTKNINQGDDFLFPIGKGDVVGNKLTLSSIRVGTISWTAEFFTPNPTYTDFADPLTYVNSKEYWTINADEGDKAKVGINWDSQSDLTPLMTENGVSDMRVAGYNTGTPEWEEISSTQTGNTSNGTVTTLSEIVIPASETSDFTTACINVTKPRARFNPSGPVCGEDGIPIEFTGSDLAFDYIIEYEKDGVLQTPVTITSADVPYTLPTDAGGAEYQLVSFTYNNSGSTTTGVVDPTIVTTYELPTESDAGENQSLCGATSTFLEGNTPVVGTGQWTIVSGTGGSFDDPTDPTTEFYGTNGTTYTLRWTISNGGCESFDEVEISFPLLPEEPLNFILYQDDVCQGTADVAYSVENFAGHTYTWSYTGADYTIVGSGNQVEISFGNNATSGTLSVFTTNDCGDSNSLELEVTVNPTPEIITFEVDVTDDICDGNKADIDIEHDIATDDFTLDILRDGVTETLYDQTDIPGNPFIYQTDNLSWVSGANPSTVYSYTVVLTNTTTGCVSLPVTPIEITVWKVPETGPQYHIPNTHGE
ncbi:MAG: choice-of-anchor J domain-containing protein [Bacteroidales bacterium]